MSTFEFEAQAKSLIAHLQDHCRARFDDEAAAVEVIAAEIESAREAGQGEAELEAEDAIDTAGERLDEIFEAVVAAGEGVPGAAKWAAERIAQVDGIRVSITAARMLARQRPRDYYAHG